MKKAKKILSLLLCAILLVGATIAGTVAYLTDTDNAVTNTFSIGKVIITLDEARVDEDGKLQKAVVDTNNNPTGTFETVTNIANADRVTENAYRLMPGKQYPKDPTIHVDDTSEDCWIFVKVVNGISAYEAANTTDYTNIAGQIAANKWTPLQNVTGVYYQSYTKGQDDKNLEVFQNFKIADNAQGTDGWSDIDGDTKITVNGYAIQKAGFETDVAGAWTAVSAAANAGNNTNNGANN